MGALNLRRPFQSLRLALVFILVIIFNINFNYSHSAGETDYLSVDNSVITLSDSLPVQFKVYPSDLTIFDDSSPTNDNRYKALYFNNSPERDNRYEYSVRSLGRLKPYYLVEITPTIPYKNGRYELVIDLVGHKPLTLTVFIDGENGNSPPVEWYFDVKCPSPLYNSQMKCIIYPELVDEEQDEQAESIEGNYKVTYYLRPKSSKVWKKERAFSWDIQKAVESTFAKLTQPIDVKLEIRFQGEDYFVKPFTVFPRAALKLMSPNAAIVGDYFWLQVNTVKQYSGKCYVNSQFAFNIKNGYGRISVYGKTPGNLDIYVSCTSTNWANTNAYKFVYIRS